MYRQRWAVEDSIKFVKDTLGWEEVQLLDLQGVRTLVALGWVAAAFLYGLGVTLDWPEVHLLARYNLPSSLVVEIRKEDQG